MFQQGVSNLHHLIISSSLGQREKYFPFQNPCSPLPQLCIQLFFAEGSRSTINGEALEIIFSSKQSRAYLQLATHVLFLKDDNKHGCSVRVIRVTILICMFFTSEDGWGRVLLTRYLVKQVFSLFIFRSNQAKLQINDCRKISQKYLDYKIKLLSGFNYAELKVKKEWN